MPLDRVEMMETTTPIKRKLLEAVIKLYLTFSSGGGTDKTEDTLVDSGMFICSLPMILISISELLFQDMS